MKILVADDHAIVLSATCGLLKKRGHTIISMCNDGYEAWSSIQLLKPEAALLDQSMPGLTGTEIAERVKKNGLDTKVIIFTMHKENALVDKAIMAGVSGYLLKDHAVEELEDCLRYVAEGNLFLSRALNVNILWSATASTALTPAEEKIWKMLKNGKSVDEIASTFLLTSDDVKKYKMAILQKMN